MNPQLFRYWIARLRPMARPQVWMPLLGVVAAGSFSAVAYQNPEMLSFISSGDRQADREEEEAIGADIDSLSLLKKEVEQNGTLVAMNLSSQAQKARPGVGKGGETLDAGSKAASKAGAPEVDPRLSLANLVRFNAIGSGILASGNILESNVAGLSGATITGQTITGPALEERGLFVNRSSEARGTRERANPLAQALDRLVAQQYSGQYTGGSPPIEGTAPIGVSDRWLPAPGSVLPISGSMSGTTGITGNVVPLGTGATASDGFSGGAGYGSSYPVNAYQQLSGATAGYPIAPVNNAGVATPIAPTFAPAMPLNGIPTGIPTGLVAPMPIYGAGAGQSEAGALPIEQNFAAPRPVPNRVIGGGTINTFSNP